MACPLRVSSSDLTSYETGGITMRSRLEAAFAAAAFSFLSLDNSAIAASTAPKPLFASDEVLHLTLRGPIGHMSKSDTSKPVPGALTVIGSAPETLPVQLSVRGLTRSKSEVCPFPPLRVEFTKKPPANSLFRGQKGLKLVTHCRAPENFQQYLLLEYGAYKMYKVLTPDSFNVRLAMIDYASEDDKAITSRLGFFIEDVDDVASRNGQKRLRGANRVSVRQIDPAASERYALFQYMIGNLDWAMNAAPAGADCCHNSRLVGIKGATVGLVPVPYDFDFSGLVNAPYAVPPPVVKVANVRVRRYRGFCAHNAQAQAAAADLVAHRASLLAILDQIPQLDYTPRQRASSYLGDFFDHAGSPAQVAEIVKTCLGPPNS